MPQPSYPRLDPRGLFCRERLSTVGELAELELDAQATASNSSAAWTTGWDLPRGDSVLGAAYGFAEQRLQLADEIVVDLMVRPDLREAPEAIRRFLLRAWPLVIAHVQLTDGTLSDHATACLRLVDDVLWSVRRDATLRRPAELFHLIPGMLERLRRGLALLGDEPPEARPFFEALERLHRPVLKLCNARRRDALVPPEPAQGQLFDMGSVLRDLRPGICVELYAGHRWVRARLDWVDPQGRQFLFKGRHGRVHAMTRRILERLVREQLLRLATSAPQLAGED